MNELGAKHPPTTFYNRFPSDLESNIDWRARLQDSVLVIIILAVVTIYFSLRTTYNLAHRLWDIVVSIIPTELLLFLDDWLDPAPFPKPPSLLRPTPSHAERSEILSRILGWNRPSSLIPSLGLLAKSATMAPPRKKLCTDRPPGLVNRDYSCFQNSVLQALSSLDNLRPYLMGLVADSNAGTISRLEIAEVLANVLADLYNPASNGETFATPGTLKNMNTFLQQDAQEYFTRLVDEVHENIQKAVKRGQKGLQTDVLKDGSSASHHSDDSGYQTQGASSKQSAEGGQAMRLPLEGLGAQRVVCVNCGYSSGLSLSVFQCLTLSLQEDRQEFSLEDLLDSYTEMERLENVECYCCTLLGEKDKVLHQLGQMKPGPSHEMLSQLFRKRLEAINTALEEDDFDDKTLKEKCKILPKNYLTSTKVKQVGIARAPESLVFHINRSRFDGYSGRSYKIHGPVEFPPTLDLGPWSLGSAGSRAALRVGEEGEDGGGGDVEQWQLPARLSMVAGGKRRSRLLGPKYQLRAVVTHQGQGHDRGHYVCYRRHPHAQAEEAETPESQDEVDEQGEDMAQSEDKISDEHKNQEEASLKWWRISDAVVSEIDEETVLSLDGVFMLFYDRVEPNSVFVPTPAIDESLLTAVGLAAKSTPDENIARVTPETPEDNDTANELDAAETNLAPSHISIENPPELIADASVDDKEVDFVPVGPKPTATESTASEDPATESIASDDTATESFASVDTDTDRESITSKDTAVESVTTKSNLAETSCSTTPLVPPVKMRTQLLS